jgi:LacI family repressor for deo operon, udp, cdd, tsx, nupC, and nupG
VAKINDVAKSAGVSTATVSRVLSNAAVVAPATRRRVMAAVERLGYAPNATAKNLRMLRTRRLLVTVPDISRPLFSLILQGIEETAHAEGYAVLLGDTQYDRDVKSGTRRCCRRRSGWPHLPRAQAFKRR